VEFVRVVGSIARHGIHVIAAALAAVECKAAHHPTENGNHEQTQNAAESFLVQHGQASFPNDLPEEDKVHEITSNLYAGPFITSRQIPFQQAVRRKMPLQSLHPPAEWRKNLYL
jgi:hypothetical protein